MVVDATTVNAGTMQSYSIKLVTAKYNPKENAVREDCVGEFEVNKMEQAKEWLKTQTQFQTPAMFYINGTQDLDCFLTFMSAYNNYYWKEYKKVKD